MTPNLDGIDTSRYQRFTGAPLPALTFAIHKATEGVKWQDPTYPQFVAAYRATPHIRHVGAYHWLRSDSSGASQAEHFLRAAQLRAGEFAVIDWERTPDRPDPTPAQVEQFRGVVAAVLGEHRVMVYSAPWVRGFKEWRQSHPQVAFCLANYRTSRLLPFNGWAESARWDATAWQYTCRGTTPGIQGHCDQNHVWKPEWFAALDQEEDEMRYALVEVTGPSAAVFIAKEQNGLLLEMEWSGPGSDPEVQARLGFLRAAGTPVRHLGVNDLRLTTLVGPVPYGDPGHAWSGGEFFRVVGA